MKYAIKPYAFSETPESLYFYQITKIKNLNLTINFKTRPQSPSGPLPARHASHHRVKKPPNRDWESGTPWKTVPPWDKSSRPPKKTSSPSRRAAPATSWCTRRPTWGCPPCSSSCSWSSSGRAVWGWRIRGWQDGLGFFPARFFWRLLLVGETLPSRRMVSVRAGCVSCSGGDLRSPVVVGGILCGCCGGVGGWRVLGLSSAGGWMVASGEIWMRRKMMRNCRCGGWSCWCWSSSGRSRRDCPCRRGESWMPWLWGDCWM